MAIKFCFLISVFFFVSPPILALKDNCIARYKTTILRKCEGPSKLCCQFFPACALRHEVRGTWVTEKDLVATDENCAVQCRRHFSKCSDKCKCGLENDEVKSSRFCKCVRSNTTDELIGSCNETCQDAAQRCSQNCATGRCPLKARTVMLWRKDVEGKCKPICVKSEFGIGIKPVCNVPRVKSVTA